MIEYFSFAELHAARWQGSEDCFQRRGTVIEELNLTETGAWYKRYQDNDPHKDPLLLINYQYGNQIPSSMQVVFGIGGEDYQVHYEQHTDEIQSQTPRRILLEGITEITKADWDEARRAIKILAIADGIIPTEQTEGLDVRATLDIIVLGHDRHDVSTADS